MFQVVFEQGSVQCGGVDVYEFFVGVGIYVGFNR